MRASTAYFAGAGTVVVAIVVGVGGGFVMADIMNRQGIHDVTKLEQRHVPPQQAEPSPQPSQPAAATNGAQAPTPYLAATRQAATAPVVVSPAPSSSPQPSNEAPSQGNANNTPPPNASPAAASEQGSPDNAYAKAHDADVKRADDKRKADRAERRQQRAARRQQQREQQQRDVEAQVPQGNDPGRNIVIRRDDNWGDSRRDDFDRPMRMDFPRFIFGQD